MALPFLGRKGASAAALGLGIAAASCVSAPFTAKDDGGADGGDAAVASFCGGETGALFCADFDTGAAAYGFGDTSTAADGTLTVDSEFVRSAPLALVASGQGVATARGAVTLERRLSELTLRFALRLDSFPNYVSTRGLRIAALKFAAGAETYAAFLSVEGTGLVLSDTLGASARLDVPINPETWMDLEVKGTWGAAGAPSNVRVALTQNGQTTANDAISWTPPPVYASVTLEIGGVSQAGALAGAPRWKARFDDVLLRGTAVP